MPNGDHAMLEKDWDKVKIYFNNISAILFKFASDFNLMIDKYYHNSKSWTFRFKHPKGGGGSVSLFYENGENCSIGNAWHINEYDTFTCYYKNGNNNYYKIADVNVYKALEDKLKEVIAWDKNDLKPHRGYKNPWGKYSKKQWLEIYSVENYPKVRL